MGIRELLKKSFKLLGSGSVLVGYHSYLLSLEQISVQRNEIAEITRKIKSYRIDYINLKMKL